MKSRKVKELVARSVRRAPGNYSSALYAVFYGGIGYAEDEACDAMPRAQRRAFLRACKARNL